MKIQWNDNNTITVESPKRPKKISGTRFAAILNENKWQSPFAIWADITKTYVKPFEDTIYTQAGKIIEPKQADYMERAYGMTLIRPTDVYGADPFKATYGDFFKDVKVLGGMWDYLRKDENGNVDAVLEMKTTKRVEDWQNDVPEYYAKQAALYAYLLGVEHVIMVASFLEEKDYEHPEDYTPNINNTIPIEFNVHERYPDFDKTVAEVLNWYNQHVLTGVSPEYDEKRDAEILEALRTNAIDTSDIDGIIKKAEELKTVIDTFEAEIADKEKELKELTEEIKNYAMTQFRDGDKKTEVKGSRYVWTIAKSQTSTIDKKKLEADGLLDKYSTVKEQYRVTVK